MSKQYTFKTTRDTEWIEPILDGLPPSDRSRTIRMALMLLFDNQRPAVTQVTPVSQQVTPEVTQVTQKDTPKVEPKVSQPKIKVVPKDTPNLEALYLDSNKVDYHEFDEPVIEAIGDDPDVDLDAKLNNLFD